MSFAAVHLWNHGCVMCRAVVNSGKWLEYHVPYPRIHELGQGTLEESEAHKEVGRRNTMCHILECMSSVNNRA